MHIENIVIETLQIKDHHVISCTFAGNLSFRFEAKKKRLLRCSGCGKKAHRHDRLPERIWQHVPLWGIPSFFIYRPWRVRCSHCGIKREVLPWATGKTRMTQALVVSIAKWAKQLSVDAVAMMFGVSWNTVYSAVKAAVAYGLEHRSLSNIRRIGIDEISRKKGHRYLTQIYDLDTGTLLGSVKDRKEESLRTFFKEYPELSETVTAVCCDMWEPFINVVRECLPKAELVYDKFHIIAHINEAVDKVRRQESNEMRKEAPKVLEKTRYIFLKNEENLTEKQQLRLKDLQRMQLKSIRAWLLKESFRKFWLSPDVEQARTFLEQWCWMASHSRLEPMMNVVKMIRVHMDGILAIFKHNISNGVVEALNNTAKAISHRARGFRTVHAYSQIMMLCMGGLEMPVLYHEFM